MFSLKLLAHSECNWALVQCLICSNSHFNFVAHSEKKKTTLRLVESHLTNDLIETLGEKLLSYRAYTGLTGLTLHKFLIEHFSQTRYINSSCFLMRNILNVVLASLNPLSGRKDGIQYVFSWGLWLHRWKLCLLFWSYKERRLVKRFYLFFITAMSYETCTNLFFSKRIELQIFLHLNSLTSKSFLEWIFRVLTSWNLNLLTSI